MTDTTANDSMLKLRADGGYEIFLGQVHALALDSLADRSGVSVSVKTVDGAMVCFPLSIIALVQLRRGITVALRDLTTPPSSGEPR